MLFDTNMDMNMINALMGLNMNNMENSESKLSNDKIGLQRGNMFNDEYKSYKGLNPNNIVANTEKDALCLKLFQTNFAIIDLNLYLDLHPDNKEMYQLYKKYVNEFENYKKMYEEKFGPLEITDATSENYSWIKNPWPWDKDGGIKYV